MMSFIQTYFVKEEEQEEMKRIFQSIDVNFDSSLTKPEFVEGLTKMGVVNAMAAANRIFTLIDTD